MREANTAPQGPPAPVNDEINLQRLRRASARRPLTEHVRAVASPRRQALMIRTCRCCGRLHRPYLQQQRAISIRGPF